MVILLPWCDFPLPDVTFCIAAVPWGWCDFSRMMWLVPLLDGRDVRFLYLMVWDEEGVRWRREFRTSCCGQCAWQLMNQGSFGGSFGGRSGGHSVVFSALVFICVLCLFLFLSSSLSFSQTVTSSLFIVSFVHSVLLLLKSNHVMQSSAGRRVVCSARGGLSRVCYNGTLYPSNEGNPLVFWWIAVTLLWPGRGDFSASGLSTFKKIALTSALDCTCAKCTKLRHLPHFTFTILLSGKDFW